MEECVILYHGSNPRSSTEKLYHINLVWSSGVSFEMLKPFVVFFISIPR